MSDMQKQLTRVDPYSLAKNEQSISSTILLADMQRLTSCVLESNLDLDVKFELHFSLDIDKLCIITGAFQAELPLRCERCLDSFNYQVSETFRVSPVDNEFAASKLPDFLEAVLLVDGFLNIVDLIEDAVLLSLPIVPKHARLEDCNFDSKDEEIEKDIISNERVNPFEVLKSLKFSKQKERGHNNGSSTTS